MKTKNNRFTYFLSFIIILSCTSCNIYNINESNILTSNESSNNEGIFELSIDIETTNSYGQNSINSSDSDNLSSSSNYSNSYDFNPNDYTKLLKIANKDFKILLLSDTQLSNKESDIIKCFDIISNAILSTNPDLLFLNGDNIEGEYDIRINNAIRLIEFLEIFKIPYVLVIGNHDLDGLYPKSIITDIFMNGKYSLYQSGLEELYGEGNYSVNIVNENNEIFYSLIMLDSGGYANTPTGYDYIHESQITWYRWYLSELTYYNSLISSSNEIVASMLLYHIGLQEVQEIYDEWILKDFVSCQDSIRGELKGLQGFNDGLFSAVKELNSTTHMFFGHHHKNMFDYIYQGVHFVSGLKTGPCSDYSLDRQGTTLITIDDNKNVSIKRLFVTN
jgi:hypothetical protein